MMTRMTATTTAAMRTGRRAQGERTGVAVSVPGAAAIPSPAWVGAWERASARSPDTVAGAAGERVGPRPGAAGERAGPGPGAAGERAGPGPGAAGDRVGPRPGPAGERVGPAAAAGRGPDA